jgi:crotonobetainyl-CoA:carnitine CoA-transferase CaiB-like acyl-CoA transferase
MMLSCYRVLDLTDEKGFLCGKALGDLGADVIKIERPGGDPSRHIGPFYHDIEDPEKNLYWFSFNANKKGITLNIETRDGREIFKKLAKTADVVIESFAPGYMEQIGLGYQVLKKVNPGIILTSITAFGQEGPYRDYKASDIVVRAMGGMVYTVGDPDRPPLTTSYPHAYLVGAIHGAIGTMVALYQRAFTGQGQQVDAPAQMGLAFVGNVEQQLPWVLQRISPQRQGRKRFPVKLKDGSLYFQPMLYRCKDGDVVFTTAAAAMSASTPGLIECMKKDGIDTGPLERWDWKKNNEGQWTREDLDEILGTIGKFFSNYTKTELQQISLDKGIHLGICLTAEEALRFPQYVARDFWIQVKHPELGVALTYPGGFAKFSDAACGTQRRAPLIGEHNYEIYCNELGLSKEELLTLTQNQVI